ncbi:MAG: hypothetical protein ACM3MF_04615 [Anaerolineae bacterium]
MSTHPTHTASIPNPALEPFRVLAGNWDTSGTHPLVPGTVVHGRSTFEWLENGAFLLWRSSVDDPQFPNGLSIIGSDDSAQQFFMLYFDERGVSRKYEVTLRDGVWKMWREAPGFSQRFTGTITDNGHTIQCQWELSRDDATWQNDMALTFTRAAG